MCYKLLVLGINLEKVTNNNNDESAAERVLEKYINKSENSTDSALFSDIFCSRGACFIFYGYTTAIFSWYQSTTHITTTDWCLKKHARVRLHVQLELISLNSQQDVVGLSGRICDLCGLIRLPRVVDTSTRKSNTGGGRRRRRSSTATHLDDYTQEKHLSHLRVSCGYTQLWHYKIHSSETASQVWQQPECDSKQSELWSHLPLWVWAPVAAGPHSHSTEEVSLIYNSRSGWMLSDLKNTDQN